MQIPLLVLLGWCMDKDMSMDFHVFETATVFLAVTIVSVQIQKGQSTWLSGLMLIGTYLIVAASFFVHINDPDS